MTLPHPIPAADAGRAPRPDLRTLMEATRRIRQQIWRVEGQSDLTSVSEAVRQGLVLLGVPLRGCAVNLLEGRTAQVATSYSGTEAIERQITDPEARRVLTGLYREAQVAYREDLLQHDPHGERERLARRFGYTVRSVLDVPIAQGTLAVNSDQPFAFDAQHIEVLRALGEVVEEALMRAEDLRALRDRTQALADQQRLLDAYQEVSREVLSTLERDAIAENLGLRLLEVGVFRSLMVAEVDHDRGIVEVLRAIVKKHGQIVATRHSREPIRYRLGEDNVTAQVARTGRLQVIEGWDDRLDARFDSPETRAGSVSYFIPVIGRGQVVAVLATASRREEKDETLRRITAMQPLLDQVALAFEHARLQRALERQRRDGEALAERLRSGALQQQAGEARASLERQLGEATAALALKLGALTRPRDLAQVVHELAEQLRRCGVHANSVSLQVVNEAGDDWIAVPGGDESARTMEIARAGTRGLSWRRRTPHPESHPWVLPVWRDGEGHVIEESTRAEHRLPPGLTVVDLPFSHGTLAVNRPSHSPFGERDLEILQRFADALSSGFQRYCRAAGVERTAVREAALRRLQATASGLESAADLPALLVGLSEALARSTVPFDYCAVDVLEAAAVRICTADAHGASTLRFAHGGEAETRRRLAAVEGTLYRPDLARDDPYGELRGGLPVRAIANVAIEQGTVAIGSREAEAFSPEDLEILAQLATVVEEGLRRLQGLDESPPKSGARAAGGATMRRTERSLLEAERAVLASMRQMDHPRDLSAVVAALRFQLNVLDVPHDSASVQVVRADGADFISFGAEFEFDPDRLETVDTMVGNTWDGEPRFAHHTWVLDAWRSGQTRYQPRAETSLEVEGERALVDAPFSHGTLGVNRRRHDAFAPSDIAVIERLAAVLTKGFPRFVQVSERLRARREAAALQQSLERQVEERTEALRRTNAELAAEVDRRQRREAELEAVASLRRAVWQMDGWQDAEMLLETLETGLRRLGVRFDFCGINLCDPTKTRWRTIGRGAGTEFRMTVVAGRSRLSAFIDTGAPIYRPDLEAHDPHDEREELRDYFQAPIRCVLDAPFARGTLAINSVTAAALSEDQIRRVEMLAQVLDEGGQRMLDLERLTEVERRYRLAAEGGRSGVWDWNLTTDEFYVDPLLKQILGYREWELRNQLQDWIERVHPEDRTAVADAVRSHLAGDTERFEVMHRMLHRDGGPRWFLARGLVMRDHRGEPYRMVGTHTDVTESQRTEAEIRAHRAELQHLSARLVEVQEQERGRLARELHDEIGQALTGLKLQLGTSAGLKGEALRQTLELAQQDMARLMGRVREMSLDLRPSVLDDLGLAVAMDWLAQRHREQTGVEVDLDCPELGRLSPPVEINAFRIVQESLTNVARHAATKEARVEVRATKETLTIVVEDEGGGFDPEAVDDGGTGGVAGMRERCRLLGGGLQLTSRPGRGTRVQACIPLIEAAG